MIENYFMSILVFDPRFTLHYIACCSSVLKLIYHHTLTPPPCRQWVSSQVLVRPRSHSLPSKQQGCPSRYLPNPCPVWLRRPPPPSPPHTARPMLTAPRRRRQVSLKESVGIQLQFFQYKPQISVFMQTQKNKTVYWQPLWINQFIKRYL